MMALDHSDGRRRGFRLAKKKGFGEIGDSDGLRRGAQIFRLFPSPKDGLGHDCGKGHGDKIGSGPGSGPSVGAGTEAENREDER